MQKKILFLLIAGILTITANVIEETERMVTKLPLVKTRGEMSVPE